MRYSNVGWIDNEIAVKRKSSPEFLAPSPKHQRSNSISEINQEASNLDETRIFANFQPFEPAQDFSHPSRNQARIRSDSILSSAPSSSEILNQTFATPKNPSTAHRPVTRSQGKLPSEPQALIASDQSSQICSSQLFSLV